MDTQDYNTFAESIKTKYPQYNNVDNLTLAKKMVEKYPVYASKVNLTSAEVKPKSTVFNAIGNALISSEKAFGQDIAGGLSSVLPKSVTGQASLDQATQVASQTASNLISKIHQVHTQGGDTTKWLKLLGDVTQQPVTSIEDLYPALKKSSLQVTGDAAGVLLDILSAGSYGKATKGAESFSLLRKTNLAEPVVKQALGQTLKTIGKETAVHSAVGGATGYAYDVAGNLQDGKTGAEALAPGGGTAAGIITPALIGGVRAGVAITKDTAPRFINSLIKPKTADFSYGKDPGRTVSELGITGNNLNDFGEKITLHKADIGTRIGDVYANPANAGLTINASDEIKKIDTAITEAAKGGKSNQGIVTALQNTKDALLYEHQVNADGVIEKVGKTPRDLSALPTQEAFDLKKLVAENTKFNGTPSDDKKVNSILKQIYGSITEKLNTAVEKNNPEIRDLNQKYADLTSAELAVKNRDAIIKKSNLISAPIKVGTAAGIISAVATGGAAIPAILVGVTATALDKALESTAVKTRVASWLGSAEPGVIRKVLEKNPDLRTVFYRLVPKLGSRIGK